MVEWCDPTLILFVIILYRMIFATPCNGVCRVEDIVITGLMCYNRLTPRNKQGKFNIKYVDYPTHY